MRGNQLCGHHLQNYEHKSWPVCQECLQPIGYEWNTAYHRLGCGNKATEFRGKDWIERIRDYGNKR